MTYARPILLQSVLLALYWQHKRHTILKPCDGRKYVTELVWDGKYSADGKRVAPVRVTLPFQTVETVNESARERQLALDFFAHGRDAEWRNRLIWTVPK